MDNDLFVMLGRIEGKLDTAIVVAEQHRQDDIRRFGEVFDRLDNHEADINQAKGAKKAVLWIAVSGATVVSGIVALAAKAFG